MTECSYPITVTNLLDVVDAYKKADGQVVDTTLSKRVFGDRKKIPAMRQGADITVGRFNKAMGWFAEHWPPGNERPELLASYSGTAEIARAS